MWVGVGDCITRALGAEGDTTMEKQPTTPVKAIKRYFERTDAQAPNGGRQVTMDELKQLSKVERDELGILCAAELNEEILLP